MELSLSHTLRLFNIFRENDGKENCAQVLEEEVYKMFCTKSLKDEHDCNVDGMNSLNTHDANNMQSHKLGDAMFDEYDIFCPPSFDEQIYYDESMPPIYDDYCDDMYAIKKKFAYVVSRKISMLVDHEKNRLQDLKIYLQALTSPATAPEKSMMSTTQPSSCRRCWASKCRGL